MKKIFALLLAAAMCLSFAACVGRDSINTDNDGEKSQENQGSINHPLLQFLYGEWEYEGNYKDSYPFAKLTVNEDGTCVVDGAAGTWSVSKDTSANGRLYIDVLVDGQTIGRAEMHIWAGNYYFGVADTMINPGDNWKHNTPVVADENDIVLTKDNWKDYFELVTESSYSENAFGDVEQLTIQQFLVPKAEYADKILVTDVVYEVQETASEYPISLNAAEKSYTLGEAVKTREPSTPDVRKLWCVYETERYEIPVTTYHINVKDHADPDVPYSKTVWLVTDVDDVTMLRVQGNIYMVNE